MFHEMGFGWMGFGWIFWLTIIGIVVYLIVNKSNHKLDNNLNQSIEQTPLNILKKRYASGDISKEEFEGMKKDLIS